MDSPSEGALEDLFGLLLICRWTRPTLKAVTNDLADARNRLVSPYRLHQVAALLNMPHLDVTAIHHDVPQFRQQAALYTCIADWARLSALAAEQCGGSDVLETADPFVYLVEYTDQHAKGWHSAPGEHFQGFVLADTAENVSQAVLARYITYLAEHREDYQLWLVDSLSLRVSVWHVNTVDAHSRDRRSCPFSGQSFGAAGILPDAVEIRTPIQIRRFMHDHIVRGREPGRGGDDASDWTRLPAKPVRSYREDSLDVTDRW